MRGVKSNKKEKYELINNKFPGLFKLKCNHKNITCIVCNKKLKLITLTDAQRQIRTASHNLREKKL